MSIDINCSKVVDRIKNDVCGDCKNRCPICEHGVCEDVVIEIGCFVLYCAEKEHEEQE